MVKLTCKFPTIQNVSLIVLKHYLPEFNWYRAITQCTHPVTVLTTKLGIKQSVSVFLRGGAWHSYSCGQTVGWIKMPLGKEVGLGPGHIVLDGTQPIPLNFRPMFIIVIVISLEHCTVHIVIGLFKFKFKFQYSMHSIFRKSLIVLSLFRYAQLHHSDNS